MKGVFNVYSITNYERPSVAVDAVVFGINSEFTNKRTLDSKKMQVLLVKRGESPFKGEYSLPGGFLRPGETTEQAISRELEEETGVVNSKLVNLSVYSTPNRDPRGWVISCAYLSLVRTTSLSTKEDSDAELSMWFDFSYTTSGQTETITLSTNNIEIVISAKDGEITCSDLAFDHAQIIYDAYKKLQIETKQNDIIFNLLPEFFTISDVQTIYEAIMNKKESAPNFRRKLLPKIIETDKYEEAVAHRNSKLYKSKKGE